MQCVFYAEVNLRRRNPTPSVTVRTAYFHPIFREIPPQKQKIILRTHFILYLAI